MTDAEIDHSVEASVVSVAVTGDDHGLGNAALLDMMTVGPNPIIDATTTGGSINWSFDSAGEAFNDLDPGESLVLEYTLRATDSLPLPVPAGLSPGDTYHLVYASSGTFGVTGLAQFPPPPGEINSLERADWQATFAAFVSGLWQAGAWDGVQTTWTAILSDSSSDAVDRVSISGPVYNTQLELVANDAADLWDGSLQHAIRFDEQGNAVATSEVWSGSTSDGTFSGITCGDWSDSSSLGEFGDATSAGTSW